MTAVTMNRAAGYGGPVAALVSIGLHVVLLIVLAVTSIRIVSEDRELLPLVIRNPAPPPLPPGVGAGGEPGAVAAPAEAPPVVEPPKPQPVVKPQPEKPKIAERPKRLPQISAAKPTPAPTAASSVASAPAQPGAGEPLGGSGGLASIGNGGGVVGGVPGGEPGGKVGGRLGGTGDDVWRADQVAVPPRLIGSLHPQYPPIARARGQEGVVIVQAVIDRRGGVEPESLRIVQSQPPFDDAALAAFRDCKFQPGRDNSGQQVRVIVQQPIRFQLR